jgi:peptidoglycan-associated lipoprotein
MRPKYAMWVLALTPMLLGGCATKKYVQEEIGKVNQRVDTVETKTGQRLDGTQSQVGEVQSRIGKLETELGQVSKTAQEALDRAAAAGKLAEGKLMYEVVLSDDSVHFPVDHSGLTKEAEAALDEFAGKLKADNHNVYIEIQGHTDGRGEADANVRLGEARANAVRSHLNMKGGIPLHRMSVISYGESEPVADNVNRAGRAQNRRVVLVVLR